MTKNSKKRSSKLLGIMFLLPLTLGLLVFRIYGFFDNIYLSFTEAGALKDPIFIGLENYKNILTDSNFWQSFFNTFKFVIICLPIILIVAIIFALLLNQKIKHIGVFRAIYFIPAIVLPVAAIQVFMWLFNTDFGIINSILMQLGLDKVFWFGSNGGITFVISMVVIYLYVSIPTFILLGGLQEIPQSYYESASIDGASKLRQFFKITLPLLSPSIFYVIILSSISLFKLFDIPYVILGTNTTGMQHGKTLVYYFYQNAFEYKDSRGYAAAVSVVLLMIILIFTALMFKLQKRWVNYEK